MAIEIKRACAMKQQALLFNNLPGGVSSTFGRTVETVRIQPYPAKYYSTIPSNTVCKSVFHRLFTCEQNSDVS